MKVVAAYLLAVLGGNTHPSMDDIKSILGSVGVEDEDEKIEMLLSQVKGKDFEELIACGRDKMPFPFSADSLEEDYEESDDDMC